MLNFLRCFSLLAFLVLSISVVDSVHAQPKVPKFKAAAVAYDPQWGDLEGNISRIAKAVGDVADQGMKLMEFPARATLAQRQPASQIGDVTLHINPNVMFTQHTPNTPFAPNAALKLSQTWAANAGWSGSEPSTWVFDPEPVVKNAKSQVLGAGLAYTF